MNSGAILIMLSTILGGFGALFIKLGASRFSIHPLKLLTNYRFLAGAALYTVSMPIYVLGLRSLPVSVAYPLTSMTYIWVTLLSAKYLNEQVDAWRWTGIACIIAGIILLNIP